MTGLDDRYVPYWIERCDILQAERDAAYAVLEKLVYHYQEAEEIIQDCVALLAKRKA